MSNLSATASDWSEIDKETASPQTTHKQSPQEYSDLEKEASAVYEDHEAKTPSDGEHILDEQEKETQRQSIASHRRQSHEKSRQEDSKEDVEKGAEEVSAEEESDPNVVGWEGPDDPQDPMNFSSGLKVMNTALVSGICFVTPLASSMFAPGVPQLMEEFKSTNVLLASFVVSVYVLGFAFGPLLLAPLSEIYGRLPIYHVCNAGFLAFTIACALATNLNMLIGFRFLEGVFGSAPLTNGGGTIADLFAQEKRGRAMSSFAMGPIVGPIIGPVAGGYLSQAKGWRWVFWILTMVSGTFAILSLIFMRETYGPIILQRKTERLRKETGNQELRSKFDNGLSSRDFFMRGIVRPAKMLLYSPIVLSMSFYVGIVYGYLYLLFTTFAVVFEDTYHFSSGSVGLAFLGLGVGSLTGLGFLSWASDHIIKKKTAAADAIAVAAGQPSAGMKPEYRLPILIPLATLIPVGLLLYGWTAKYHVHWIVPIISTALIGIGNMAVFMCITMYLIDAYTVYAASALAANTVIRSVMGAVLPLCGQKMYKALGLGWGNSLLAFIALAMVPVPWVLLKWGEPLRKRFEIKNL